MPIVSSDLIDREALPTVMAGPPPLHVPIGPGEGGVLEPASAMCDDLLPLRREMPSTAAGRVPAETLAVVNLRLKEIVDP